MWCMKYWKIWKDKKYLIVYASSFIPIDIIIKLLLSKLLNLPFIELNQTGYYYFSSYVFTISLFIKLFTLLIEKIFIDYKNNKEIYLTTISYLILFVFEFIGLIIINYSLVKIVYINQINYPILTLINILYGILFLLIITISMFLQRISINKEKELLKYKEINLTNTYNGIYIAQQEELFKIRHDIANVLNSIKNSSINSNDIVNEITKEKIESKFSASWIK